MCGITGVLKFKGAINKDTFKLMNKAISRRGPDDEGYLFGNMNSGHYEIAGDSDTPDIVYESAIDYTPGKDLTGIKNGYSSLALANRRLSILDLSPAGHQPMSNGSKSLWIVFNGEVYNYKEIRIELERKGHFFHSDSDTEVILKSYEQWGKDCLQRFNGMWAFCIWDVKRKELFCARDRLGVKPFYYYLDSQIFAFSSEMKSLLHPDIIGRQAPNDALIYDYLKYGYLDHTNKTFFSGIRKLPQACYLKINVRGQTVLRQYWDVEITNEEGSNAENSVYAEEFLDIFKDSVRLRLRSDVPVGSCLSGGLDSSAIVCAASGLLSSDFASQNPARLQTFSSCFEDKAYDERDYIETVVEHTGVERNYVFPDYNAFIDEVDRILWQQEEPFGGSSIFAQWCVMRRIHEKGVKVVLDGQGADEQLAGYRKFYIFYFLDLLKKRKYLKSLEIFQFLLSLEVLKTLNLTKGLKYSRLGNNFLNLNSLMRDSVTRNFKHKDEDFVFRGNIGNRMKEDLFRFSLPALLRYSDKNSMAFSVETRLPYLDYRLVERLASFPLSQKMSNGWTKYVLRNAMVSILPEKIRLRKSKLGFVTPEDHWFRKCISKEIQKVFLNATFLQQYVRMDRLQDCFDRYLGRKTFYQSDIFFRFYILEKWGQKFF